MPEEKTAKTKRMSLRGYEIAEAIPWGFATFLRDCFTSFAM